MAKRKTAGRQGRQPGRDGQSRPAGAAGLHHHHRGLHAFTPTANLSRTELKAQVEAALAKVGSIAGKTFGDPDNPLLVSVRSGARASMPGMMDTVLNLGLNDEDRRRPGQASGDRRFAYDSYRRFIQMYSDVVLGVDHHISRKSSTTFKDARAHARHRSDRRRLARGGRRLQGARSRANWASRSRRIPHDQLWGAIGAVFGSWMNPRANTYRRLHDIPKAGAPRSTCRRWCSAIWARPRPPASPSPAIPRPARTSSTANS
jgi:phosphoenolpyruvate synthase/pyruvate phosphate dikinase